MRQATYTCGHSAEAEFKLPADCPLCSRYGDAKVTTKEKITEKLAKAYKVKPIIPSGGSFDAKVASICFGVEVLRAWQLVIDGWHPMRLNQAIRHWVVMKQAKDEATNLLALAARSAGCTNAIGKRAVALKLEGFRVCPDADAYDKVVLDAMVRSGLLRNDDNQGIHQRLIFQSVRGGERRTTILIGDVL